MILVIHMKILVIMSRGCREADEQADIYTLTNLCRTCQNPGLDGYKEKSAYQLAMSCPFQRDEDSAPWQKFGCVCKNGLFRSANETCVPLEKCEKPIAERFQPRDDQISAMKHQLALDASAQRFAIPMDHYNGRKYPSIQLDHSNSYFLCVSEYK